MKKDIIPFNEKGERHGHCEVYYDNAQLILKGNFVNGKRNGYFEEYYENGQLWYKGYYVNGKSNGYFEEYYENGQLMFKGYYDMGIKVDHVVNNDLIFEVI